MKTIEIGTRIETKNILFTTDFSPAADSALPYATEFAARPATCFSQSLALTVCPWTRLRLLISGSAL
jgi:hypothetical protein